MTATCPPCNHACDQGRTCPARGKDLDDDGMEIVYVSPCPGFWQSVGEVAARLAGRRPVAAAPERVWIDPTGITQGHTEKPEEVTERDVEYRRADVSYQEASARAEAAEAEVARLEEALHGSIKPLTDADYANIIAHLSYELEPTGPLPNRNSAFMALVDARNALADARVTVVRLRGALECARAIFDNPIGLRRLGLDPHDERLTIFRAALTQKDRTDGK